MNERRPELGADAGAEGDSPVGAPPDGAGDTEAAFLARYDPRRFPPLTVTVDMVVLTVRQDRLAVLLIRRRDHPHRGAWALPGGFIGADEEPDDAAGRELAEECGPALAATAYLDRLNWFAAVDRDPRLRVVSLSYLALVPDAPDPVAGVEATDARFWYVDEIDALALAFDHHDIVAAGLERARNRIEYTNIASSFVQAPFTISELRRVYETMWGVALERNNFRRKLLDSPGFIEPTGDVRAGGAGRPARLFRAGPITALRRPILRPDGPPVPDVAPRRRTPAPS